MPNTTRHGFSPTQKVLVYCLLIPVEPRYACKRFAATYNFWPSCRKKNPKIHFICFSENENTSSAGMIRLKQVILELKPHTAAHTLLQSPHESLRSELPPVLDKSGWHVCCLSLPPHTGTPEVLSSIASFTDGHSFIFTVRLIHCPDSAYVQESGSFTQRSPTLTEMFSQASIN